MMMKFFILIDEGLIILSKYFLRVFLFFLVLILLKDKYGFSYKDRFVKVMELYIGLILNELLLKIIFEKEIISIYK